MKTRASILISFFLVFASDFCQAQLTLERLAWSNLGKERWLKAEVQLRKALRKDSLNLGANYAYAWFFFTQGNPKFNVDSASLQTNRTFTHFNKLNKKEKERALRTPFDSSGLFRLRALIDSAAFQRAKEQNTEDAYAFFVTHFPQAVHVQRSIELQHEVAFLNALKENSYQSFATYLAKYPSSERAAEAKNRYEKLLFEVKTKDKKLASYVLFLKEHPQSQYRLVAEKNIFELMTASGEVSAFQHFISAYPKSGFARQAQNFLYHLNKENGFALPLSLTDSLLAVSRLEKQVWFPILKNGLYGFIDASGQEKLMDVSDSLDADVVCEGFNQDVLFAGSNVIARNGTLLAQHVEAFEDMGAGFLKLTSTSGIYVLHKSGVRCLAADANLIGTHFFLTSDTEQCTLYTLSGRKLLSGFWREVVSFGSVVGFRSDKGWQLITTHALAASADGAPLSFIDFFDEVKRIDANYIQVRSGSQQALLSNSLQVVIPLAEQRIVEEEGFIVIRSSKGAQFFIQEKVSKSYESIQVTKKWLSAKSTSEFFLEDRLTHQRFVYDSVAILPQVAIGIRNDTLFLHVEERVHIFSSQAEVDMLTVSDQALLCVLENGIRTLISIQGEKLGSFACDKLEYAGGHVVVLTRKDKKTLADLTGKPILLTEFETFGNVTQRDIAVLAKRKFGLIKNNATSFIKPLYERSLRSYNDQLVVAYKEGAYGFVTWENIPVGKFEFEEVLYWNDSVALVQHNFSWRLLNLHDMTFTLGKVSSYSTLQKSSGEMMAIYHQDNYYGVMSNQRGVILEPTFTSIQNIGSAEEPFYFTEKYVEEAAIYVVIYYNDSGKQVRRQVFEEDEFDKIVCKE